MYPQETRIYIAVLTGLLVLVILMTFFIINIIRYQRKKVALHREKVKEQFAYLDKERERIAFDLHDDLGAYLSAIKIHLQCLKGLDGENASIVTSTGQHIDEAMKKLRHISFNLMPGVLQRQGLNEALKELIGLMTYSTKIAVNYKCDIEHFEKQEAINIFHLVQEILNNIIRHSKATRVNFSISQINNMIELHINDNGIGFNKKAVLHNGGGLGLHSIAARVDRMKGKINLITAPDKGVDFLVNIPANGT